VVVRQIYQLKDVISPAMSMEDALQNADTYALYAKAVWYKC
jgi:hypothetical protein